MGRYNAKDAPCATHVVPNTTAPCIRHGAFIIEPIANTDMRKRGAVYENHKAHIAGGRTIATRRDKH